MNTCDLNPSDKQLRFFNACKKKKIEYDTQQAGTSSGVTFKLLRF